MDIIEEGERGLVLKTVSPEDLAEKIVWVKSHPIELIEMGKEAPKVYNAKYIPQTNYEPIVQIYSEATESQSVSTDPALKSRASRGTT